MAFWYQTGIPTFEERAPEADERRLPSLARVSVQASNFVEKGRYASGELQKSSARFYEGDVLVYQPSSQAKAWVEIPIEVKAEEPLRLVVNVEQSLNGGRYQAFLDGIRLGRPLDFYNDTPRSWTFPLLDFWPAPGTYTFRLECLGKNTQSSGLACRIESVQLLERRPRVAEYGYDKDKDWRKDPVLYR